MFDNIGKKIMSLAKILVVLDIIGTVILAIILVDAFYEEFLGVLVALVSGTFSVITCWPLYAFGQLVDDVHAIRYNNTAAAAEPVVKEYEVPEL